MKVTTNRRRFFGSGGHWASWVACVCLGSVLGLNTISVLAAQEAKSADTISYSADVVFEINLSELRQSLLFSDLDWQKIIEIKSDNHRNQFNLLDGQLKSIAGAFELPDFEAPDVPQNNFFLICRFENALASQQFLKALTYNASHTMKEISGKKFVRVDSLSFYGDVYAGAASPSSLLVGTQGYLRAKRQSEIPTRAALQSWRALPKISLRIALDCEAARSQGYQMLAAALLSGSPEASEVLGTMNLIKRVGIGLDLEKDLFLTVHAAPVEERKLEELRSGLDGLLFLSRTTAKKSLASAGFQNAKVDAACFDVIQQMQTSLQGKSIEVNVSHPKYAEEALRELNSIIRRSLDNFSLAK